MEKTKLNLSVPLLSVRRINSGQLDGVSRKNIENSPPNRQQSLCVPKSDCDSSEVTKPVAVPFCWEQAPGKRRGENGGKIYPYEDPSTMPKLPPGRKPDSKFYSSERSCFRSQNEAPSMKDHTAILDSLVESMNAKGEFDVERRDCAFSDPLETLTVTESLSLNCSISGLSGCQGPDVEPSGAILADSSTTRDFMMSRFLPAAKAAVLETTQFVPKKDLLVTEQPKPLVKKNEPYIVPYYSDYAEDIVTENEDEATTTDQLKRPRKFWKLFPRLSVKSSLGLLNPFPGLKVKSQTPMSSSTNEVKRLTRYASPSRPLNKARKAYSGPLEKQSYDAIYKQRFSSRALSGELCKADKRSISNQFSKTDLEYPNNGSRSGAISPYRNVTSSSRFNEGTRFLGVPREVENLKGSMFSSFRIVDGHPQDTPTESMSRRGSDSLSDVVEKTVYVDSVNYVKIPNLDLSSSKPNGAMDSSVENVTSKIVEQNSSAKSCRTKGSNLNQELNHQQQGSKESTLVHSNGNANASNRDSFKPDNQSYSDVTSPLSPCPPLPKSPSESWLWRTLPSFPSRGYTDHMNQSPRATNTAIKREITAKSCNKHHSNVYYSEELVPHGSHIW